MKLCWCRDWLWGGTQTLLSPTPEWKGLVSVPYLVAISLLSQTIFQFYSLSSVQNTLIECCVLGTVGTEARSYGPYPSRTHRPVKLEAKSGNGWLQPKTLSVAIITANVVDYGPESSSPLRVLCAPPHFNHITIAIKTVNPKGNQPWIFIERTGVEAKAPILWPPPMGRANSLEKTLMLGKTEGRRRREGTEDEMVGWHHWLRGHKFEQTLGDSEGQGSLANSSPWDHRERSNLATEQQDILQTLKWSKVKWSCSVMSDFLRPHGL